MNQYLYQAFRALCLGLRVVIFVGIGVAIFHAAIEGWGLSPAWALASAGAYVVGFVVLWWLMESWTPPGECPTIIIPPKAPPRRHCCSRMRDAVDAWRDTCRHHSYPTECPDALIDVHDDHTRGIIIHDDAGGGMVEIHFCPWCGTRIPIIELEFEGFDNEIKNHVLICPTPADLARPIGGRDDPHRPPIVCLPPGGGTYGIRIE